MGANPTVIGNWFQLLKKIQDTAGIISPDQIWSGDETGVQNVPKEVKVLGVKHIRTFQQVSSEQGETSTILSFVSAGGKVCPPLVIHKDACTCTEDFDFCSSATQAAPPAAAPGPVIVHAEIHRAFGLGEQDEGMQ